MSRARTDAANNSVILLLECQVSAAWPETGLLLHCKFRMDRP